MKITYFGHSCFLIETKGKNLLLDPFITPNELASEIDVDKIEVDYILASHGHEDHVADIERVAKRTNAKLVSSWELVTYYEAKDIQGHPMNFGGKWNFDFGTVWYVPASHSSSLPDGSYAGNPGGFIIHNEEGTLYYSGDTAVMMDMQLFPRLYPKIDIAIMPIGDNFTMDTQGALIAAEFVDCDRVIGCHYDTFGYIKIDHEASKAIFSIAGKELTLLPINGSMTL